MEEVHARLDIRVFFEHKLSTADFDAHVLTFRDVAANKDVQVDFNLCKGGELLQCAASVGALRAVSHSSRAISPTAVLLKFINGMALNRMDFQQTYIPHGYLELKMPAGKEAEGNAASRLTSALIHAHSPSLTKYMS